MKEEEKHYNKNEQILQYFKQSFNENCKYNCKEQYNDLITCFKKNKHLMNETNMALPIPMSKQINKPNKSFDKTNECFEQATSYFICLVNESSKFEDL